MKRYHLLFLISILSASACFAVYKILADEPPTFQVAEYGIIHWNGRENSFFLRPNGKVEMLGPLLSRAQRPDKVDERIFYLNLAMNAVAKEGYEFAGTTPDGVLMKRSTGH